MKNATVLQQLLDAGISSVIATSMVKALNTPVKKKKKGHRPAGTARTGKTEQLVVVTQTCVTCNKVTTFKKLTRCTDEEALDQKCVTSLCENCITVFESMSKEELIALLVIQNHKDIELRNLGSRTQIKLARQKSARDWFTTTLDHVITKPDVMEEICIKK